MNNKKLQIRNTTAKLIENPVCRDFRHTTNRIAMINSGKKQFHPVAYGLDNGEKRINK